MYVTVELKSIVIWDIIIFMKYKSIFNCLLVSAVMDGDYGFPVTISDLECTFMQFLMHAKLCWDICAFLVSFSFPLVFLLIQACCTY